MTTKKRKLTDLDIQVLLGAKEDRLWRSESGRDLYDSYLNYGGRGTKVNRQVDKLSRGDDPLLHIGDGVLRRPWHLTAAGEDALTEAGAQ